MDLLNLYRRLLRLYPASFRDEYGEPMEQQFRDEQRDARGSRAHLCLWVQALSDIAVSAPRELGRELGEDLRFAARVYARRPISAIIAVGTLALAVGASTGVFSVASALLLRALPFADAGRLVELRSSPFGAGISRAGFIEWRDKSTYLENAATFSTSEMNLNMGRDALRVRVTETSANLFGLLGVRCSPGRAFVPGEDRVGEGHVAVISHRIWQQSYGGDPSVIGSVVHLNGAALAIVGVAPPEFDYPGGVDVWISTVFDMETIPRQGAVLWQTIGRLRPGVTMAAAGEQFRAEIARVSPDLLRRDLSLTPELVGLHDQLSREIRRSVLILLSVVILVLLTACANVAQLLLSRTVERSQELSLRSALGASRGRLVQQLSVEAMGLTLCGSASGMVVALVVSRLANGVLPAQLETQRYTLFDWRVLCFAVLLALIAGVVSGILPAWLIGRLQPSTQLVRVRRGAGEPAAVRLRSILLGLQVAFALTLLVSSLTLGRAFLRLIHTDLGFHPANVVTLSVATQGTRYESGAARGRLYASLQERLRSIPGVEAVGAVNYLPLANNLLMAGAIRTDSGRTVERVVLNGVMPGYFGAMGTRLIGGADFGGRTGPDTGSVIVNEAFARQAGFGREIVGRHITAFWSTRPYLVSGLVATARSGGPQLDGGPEVFWPVEEEPPASLTFVASVHGNPVDYLARCRDAVTGFDRTVPVYDVKTLDQRLDEKLGRPRFYTISVLSLGSLTLLIAVAGVYGSCTRLIIQRQHELGVRVALGASMRSVRALVLGQSLVPVVPGILGGGAGALGVGLVLRHLFIGAGAPDVPAFAWASGSLLVLLLGTAWSVTARILAIDPMESIRAE